MTAYSGSALYLQWIYSGGTVLFNTDYRSFTYTPAIDLYDQSAGSDPAKTFVTGQKSGSGALAALMQAGGTAVSNAMAEGAAGTMIVAPEGTASGKQKITLPMIAMGAKFSVPFNNLVEVSCDFTQNGERTDGVY